MAKIYIWVFFFLMATYGCHKKSNEQLAIANYPVAVGDEWTYQVTNNLSGVVDTAYMTVTNKSVFNNDSTVFNTQTIENGALIDSGLIVLSPNCYKYLPSGFNGLFEKLVIRFPIDKNSVWIGDIVADTITVLETNETKDVLNTSYTNVIEISRNFYIPDYGIIALINISPNIGIIQETMTINLGYIASNKNIQLISYKVN